ncbi:MAG: class I SAM-dependent methyltransferase [Anaerolineae bacterium]|nr:class I SAM-dependent methyltransferase [Anaerolineae bacterium]
MADNIVKAFTELAPRYEKTMDRELRFMWGLPYRDFVNRLVQVAEVEEGSRILDIATGTAVIPLSIGAEVRDSVQVVGLDITPAMLRQGMRNVRRAPSTAHIDLVCGSAMSVSLADGVFDMVVCGLAMHHLNVARTLSEIGRVLTEDGRLNLGVVGVPLFWRSWWGEKIVVAGIRAFYRFTHGGPRAQAESDAFYNLHTGEEWRAILSASGFVDIEITEIPSRFRWGPNALFVKARLASPAQ